MKNKYFFTKKFSCCPLNNLIPNEIKKTYTNTKELNKHTIQRSSYLGEVSRVLGFPKWSIFQEEFETKVLPPVYINKNDKDYSDFVNRILDL